MVVKTIGPPDANGVSLVIDESLNRPMAVAIRPGDGSVWVTNSGNDSITILTLAGATASVRTVTDAFAEHFVARPSGLAFVDDGTRFAVANNSNNEVRDLEFKINPERNVYFKGNNFMGPTLFASDTYGLAGQSKKYLDDWPQPGYGHDPPDDVPEDQCPSENWSVEVRKCIWPREGSHLDMLHGDPLSMGIASAGDNVFFVLDGCGTREAGNMCSGKGHVAMVDFNRDHQEGNGFHGDGVHHRYIDAPFKRLDDVPSGIIVRGDDIVYSDTGAGVVRRFRRTQGRTEVLAGPWHAGAATRNEHGPGVMDWSSVENGPGDGDSPEVIDAWIARAGKPALIAQAGERWIRPQETLGEYAYVYGTTPTEVVPKGTVEQPSGLAASETSLFVADHRSGNIIELRWSDLQVVRTIRTGRTGLGGMTYSAAEKALYVTSTTDNALYRVAVG